LWQGPPPKRQKHTGQMPPFPSPAPPQKTGGAGEALPPHILPRVRPLPASSRQKRRGSAQGCPEDTPDDDTGGNGEHRRELGRDGTAPPSTRAARRSHAAGLEVPFPPRAPAMRAQGRSQRRRWRPPPCRPTHICRSRSVRHRARQLGRQAEGRRHREGHERRQPPPPKRPLRRNGRRAASWAPPGERRSRHRSRHW
jgi:hypothetical protein